jgi:hypothetical protein
MKHDHSEHSNSSSIISNT